MLAAPVLLASSASGQTGGPPAVSTPVEQTISARIVKEATIKAPASLRKLLFANFDRATRGTRGARIAMSAMPNETSAGIGCSPAHLTRSAPRFRITLPRRFADRRSTFVAITPRGDFRIIYIGYGIDTDPEDLIIPSRAIDWESARTRNVFRVDARRFDALHPDEAKPRLLFREAGIYQFALLDGIDRELLELLKSPFRLIAGCVVHWRP